MAKWQIDVNIHLAYLAGLQDKPSAPSRVAEGVCFTSKRFLGLNRHPQSDTSFE
jgi:hypothetical protein